MQAFDNAPRVFLSYSHDSRAHKQWVGELATFLRENGVDAGLDQWDLSPGDDVTKFMEDGLQHADRVLVICTDEYIRKAEGGVGGVAYERMIVTAELVRDLGTKKFVPVVRDIKGPHKLPVFLGARLWIDLSDDCQEVAENRQRLLKELHNVSQLAKPALGPNPFLNAPSGASTALVLPNVSTASDPAAVYATAVELTRRSDLMGWRQLSKTIRASVLSRLTIWRQKYDAHNPPDDTALLAAVEEAVQAVAPHIVLALAGVESRIPEFVDQRALLDDLLNLAGWSHMRHDSRSSFAWTLGFVYHGLHGAMAIATDQLDVAFSLADIEVRNPASGYTGPLVQHRRLVGWPPLPNGSATAAWNFLADAAQRWPWLDSVFGGADEYRKALVAYYLLLSLDEFARTASSDSGRQLLLVPQPASLEIPIAFVDEDDDVMEDAVRRVRRFLPLMRARWAIQKRPVEELPSLWKGWVSLSRSWLRDVYPHRDVSVHWATIM